MNIRKQRLDYNDLNDYLYKKKNNNNTSYETKNRVQ